jgi:hypothetical protein
MAPMFRKLPGEVNLIGRKITNTANDAQSTLGRVSKAIDAADRAVPNPLTKLAKQGIGGVQDITKGVGIGGQALRAVSRGDLAGAGSLTQEAVSEASKGLGGIAGSVLGAAAFV